MDLYEYQAKELFAAHGVPVLPGRTVADRGGGGRRGRRAGRDRGGQGAGQDRWPGQGGWGEAGHRRRRRPRRRPRRSSAWTSRGTPCAGCWSPRPATSPRSTTSRSCSTGPTARSWRWPAEGGMEIEQLAATKPGRARADPGRRDRRGRRGEGRARSSPRRGSRTAVADQAADVIVQLWETFVGEDATLVEVNPLVRDPARRGRRAGRQGHPGRQRRLPAPGARRIWSTSAPRTRSRPRPRRRDLNYVKLEDGQVGIIGNGAGLVMSTLDVVAYAGERFGGVKPANFLDIGGGASATGDGRRAGHHPARPGRQEWCSSTSSAGSPRATRWRPASSRRWRSSVPRRPSRWSSGWTATTSSEGRRILDEANHPLVTLVDTMDDAADKAAELAAAGA